MRKLVFPRVTMPCALSIGGIKTAAREPVRVLTIGGTAGAAGNGSARGAAGDMGSDAAARGAAGDGGTRDVAARGNSSAACGAEGDAATRGTAGDGGT